jgi:glycosyltransferase involved in cell wall biosynthesis
VKLFGIERLLNRFLAPLLPPLCFSVVSIARLPANCSEKTVSVVVPARNEAGNIEAAVKRTRDMGVWTEIIFVEGNSKDNKWQEIGRVKGTYPQKQIKILQQTGIGKGNAVRAGFAVAEGDLLMILNADLTMPPEELPKFYDTVGVISRMVPGWFIQWTKRNAFSEPMCEQDVQYSFQLVVGSSREGHTLRYKSPHQGKL